MGLCSSKSEEEHIEHDVSYSVSAVRLKGKVVEGKKRVGYLMKEELAELKESLHQKRALCLTSHETQTLTTMFNKSADRVTKTLDKMSFLRVFMRAEEGEGMFEAAHDEKAKTKGGKYKHKHKKDAHGKVEQVFELFTSCDVDGNGKIDLQEFLGGVSFWKQQADFSPQGKLLLYFNMFDTSGSGKLNKSEFQKLMCHMLTLNPHGEYEKEMVEKLAKTLFASIDKKDSDRGVSLKEFQKWCSENPDAGIEADSVEAVFSQFDTDGNKKLTKSEFTYLVKQRHMQSSTFEDGPIKARLDKITNKVYKAVDVDNSGSIDFEEFHEWLMADASVGTVQNLCDVMKDVVGDLKKLNKTAKDAMGMIVQSASKGLSQEEIQAQKEKEATLVRKKREAKEAKKNAKKQAKLDKTKKIEEEKKAEEDAIQEAAKAEALTKKASYKVAAASNPFAREHSALNSPRT